MLGVTAAVLCLLAQAPVPVIAVETDVVHVEAVVTDRKGRVVGDLTREAFTLYVDGRPVPIGLFEPAGALAPPAGAGSTNPHEAAAPAAATRPAGPLVVLHLDADNLTPAGRLRALAGLGEWVAELSSRQPVRVLVTIADRGIRLLAPVTSDPATLARAIAEAGAAPVHGMRRIQEERTVRETVREIIEGAESTNQTCVDVLNVAQSVIEAHARMREAHQQSVIDGLAGLVAALGTVPGNKWLVYLTEGLEQFPGLPLFHQLADVCPAAGQMDLSALIGAAIRYDVSRPLQELAARANAARVTLYPVDAAGLTSLSSGDPSHASRRFTPSARNDSVARANFRAGPGILADETGGVAVFDRNRPATGLEALERDLGSRYLLGFTPPTAPDGRRHTLRVEVRQRGLTVRHRRSYWHAEATDAHVSRTWAALVLGHEEDGLGAVVAAVMAADEEPAQLALRLRLPAGRLGAEMADAGRRARLRVVIAVRGDGRDPAARQQAREKTIELPMDPEPGAAEAAWREVVVRLPFPRGEEVVAVGIHDLISGGTTYRRLVVRPGSPD